MLTTKQIARSLRGEAREYRKVADRLDAAANDIEAAAKPSKAKPVSKPRKKARRRGPNATTKVVDALKVSGGAATAPQLIRDTGLTAERLHSALDQLVEANKVRRAEDVIGGPVEFELVSWRPRQA